MQDTQHSLHIWPFDLIQEVVEAWHAFLPVVELSSGSNVVCFLPHLLALSEDLLKLLQPDVHTVLDPLKGLRAVGHCLVVCWGLDFGQVIGLTGLECNLFFQAFLRTLKRKMVQYKTIVNNSTQSRSVHHLYLLIWLQVLSINLNKWKLLTNKDWNKRVQSVQEVLSDLFTRRSAQSSPSLVKVFQGRNKDGGQKSLYCMQQSAAVFPIPTGIQTSEGHLLL